MVDVKVYRTMKMDGWCQKDSRGKGGEVSQQTDASRRRTQVGDGRKGRDSREEWYFSLH